MKRNRSPENRKNSSSNQNQRKNSLARKRNRKDHNREVNNRKTNLVNRSLAKKHLKAIRNRRRVRKKNQMKMVRMRAPKRIKKPTWMIRKLSGWIEKSYRRPD
jgi:hypothetical protein